MGVPSPNFVFSNTNLRTLSLSYICTLIKKCTGSKCLKPGKQIHLQVVVRDLVANPFVTTKLIQFYADCDQLVPAIHSLKSLDRPNVFAWTAILAFYSRDGELRHCLQIYQEMRAQGVSPDGYVFPPMLKVCGRFSSLVDGIRVHGEVIKFGATLILQVCNSLIDMYSKCGSTERARQVFDEMLARDVVSWNSVISGYICCGLLDSAKELLALMKFEGFEPDLVTWNTIMGAYGKIGLCREAFEIFSQIKEPDIISWTTLILGYSRCGKHEKALIMFRKLIQEGHVFPDQDILSCVLSSCQLLGDLKSGREIHGFGIRTQGAFGFYCAAGPALVKMYAVCSRIEDAKNVFKMMDKRDTVTWNSIISGFSNLGTSKAALGYFQGMYFSGVKFDESTVSTVLPICHFQLGREIHAQCFRKFQTLTVFICNALISTYFRCGYVGLAYAVFSNMNERDVVTWNTMIRGCGLNGHGRAALFLLQEMRQFRVKPNSVTFTNVLSACSHSGLVDEGLKLFDRWATDFGIEPRMEQFACVVDMLGRVGRIEDAMDFINKMAIEPASSVWGSLLASCRVQKNVNIAEIAAEHLFRLEPFNPGNYVTLSNIYLSVGRSDDALRVRKLMENRELTKCSGYSWIQPANGPI